jgi:hypothetical protein
MSLTQAERDEITQRVAVAVANMLTFGKQAATVQVPELDETWTISREPEW